MTTEVSQLIEEYKNLANKTIDNCQSCTTTLPQKIEEANSTIQNLQPTVTTYINTLITDVQRGSRLVQEFVGKLHVGRCVFVVCVNRVLVVGPTLGIFMGMVLTGSSAALLSLVIILYLIINNIPTMEGSEEDRRMNLLVATVVDSLVMVVLLSGSRMNFFSPPAFILTLGMGCAVKRS